MANVTRQTYARGVAEYLQQSGVTRLPSEAHVKHAAAMAAGFIRTEPATQAVTHEECYKVAQIIEAYDSQLRSTGKFASVRNGASISGSTATAFGDLIALSYKLAMEGGDGGGLVGVDMVSQNTIANSPDAAAALDALRPENYAVVAPGGANFSEPQAARVGIEMPHPLAPTDVMGAGTNSVIEASKAASLNRLLRKLAESSVISDSNPQPPNTVANSPDAASALDALRPENYAVVPPGGANFSEPQAARVGVELPHPLAPTDAPGTNSVVEASKAAAANWNSHFNRTANVVGKYLPGNMPMEQKIAAVKQCMALEPHEMSHYLNKVASAWGGQNTLSNTLNSLNAFQR